MAKIRGWVYIISNPAMPNIYKIGFSTKDPELRAKEFNQTNSPHPYVVEYDALVESPRDMEQAVHKILNHKREGKEWFRCTLEEAVLAVRQIIGTDMILENYKKVDRDKIAKIEEEQKRKKAEEESIAMVQRAEQIAQEARNQREIEKKQKLIDDELLNSENEIKKRWKPLLETELTNPNATFPHFFAAFLVSLWSSGGIAWLFGIESLVPILLLGVGIFFTLAYKFQLIGDPKERNTYKLKLQSMNNEINASREEIQNKYSNI